MVPSDDCGFTPVKVRGKRHGTPAEKWHTGKRRKPELQRRSHLSTVSSSASSLNGSRKRRRKDVGEDSPLEMLPTEVVQQIFEYSANINLPLVSRQLAAKLSKSTHLEYQLTDTLLSPVLRLLSNEEASVAQLAAATRLLNSRFVTFAFFKSWLHSHNAAELTEMPDHTQDETNWRTMWATLQPSPNLLPPRKLLSPPFTEAKSSFLAVLVQGRLDLASIDPAYGEFAHQGVRAAVAEGRSNVVSLMLRIGVVVTTELLRVAVDSGCDKDIVLMLLDSSADAEETLAQQEGVNLLDPSLWAWAEKARGDGNEKGQWLVALMRERQHRKSTLAPPA